MRVNQEPGFSESGTTRFDKPGVGYKDQFSKKNQRFRMLAMSILNP
jgi:hypothetical protein